MGNSNGSIIATGPPIQLTPEEGDTPQKVLADFYQTYDLNDIRDIIVDVFSIALCAKKSELEGRKRTDILFTQKQLVLFIEASYLLNQLTQITGKK